MKTEAYSPLILFLGRHLGALLAITLTTLVLLPFAGFLSLQIIVLLYLLPVILSTTLFGLTPGLLSGFLAFLTFNYFFIQPYHTLRVHALQDVISLIVFLVVAVVMSQFIGQARAGLRLARNREWEATRMYELISALSGLQDIESVVQTLATHILETFPCDLVEVYIPARPGESTRLFQFPLAKEHPSQEPTRVQLMTTRRPEGELRLWFQTATLTPEEIRLLDATASQGALALERVHLSQSENKARVLEESDQLKSSLLNSVSHELRSPLAAIKASVSSLRSGAVDWDLSSRQELLATIEEETDQLNLLVGNLLDMSRIEAGALKPQLRWNSLSEITVSVVQKMRKNLQGHHLKMDLPEDLPLVPTDFILVQQVFTNLLSNSAKYAPPGTDIQISARQEGDSLHVRVINRGPSVPETDLERIFDKFYRITAAERVTGTGLGLSICKGIIEAHGGKIWAENQQDAFMFHFTLPLTLNGALPALPREAGDG